MLPDLGGLARELSGANVLATIQLLDCRHHRVYRIKEQSGGELQRGVGEGKGEYIMHTHRHKHTRLHGYPCEDISLFSISTV